MRVSNIDTAWLTACRLVLGRMQNTCSYLAIGLKIDPFRWLELLLIG